MVPCWQWGNSSVLEEDQDQDQDQDQDLLRWSSDLVSSSSLFLSPDVQPKKKDAETDWRTSGPTAASILPEVTHTNTPSLFLLTRFYCTQNHSTPSGPPQSCSVIRVLYCLSLSLPLDLFKYLKSFLTGRSKCFKLHHSSHLLISSLTERLSIKYKPMFSSLIMFWFSFELFLCIYLCLGFYFYFCFYMFYISK